jgi:VanZ family protein
LQGAAAFAMNLPMSKPSRAFLHAARLADAVLFWPVFSFVLWGQLQPEIPGALQGINDKLLHVAAYFVLGAMAGGAIRQRSQVKWAVLALILAGALMEVVQGSVGREASMVDVIANAAGAIAGAAFARFVLDPLRRRWGYDTDLPSA